MLTICINVENMDAKRRKATDAKVVEVEREQEEHSLSLSQHSSPSQSDQEQNIQKLPTSATDSLPPRLVTHLNPYNPTEAVKIIRTRYLAGDEALRQPMTKQFLRTALPPRQESPMLGAQQKPQLRPFFGPLVGCRHSSAPILVLQLAY